MPIPPDIRREYYSKRAGWPETRQRILDRSQHCCERCGAPSGVSVLRGKGGVWFDTLRDRLGVWIKPGDLLVDLRPPIERGIIASQVVSDWLPIRKVTVQLGVAHIDHDSSNNSEDNLAGWCRECHLQHDQPQHKRTRQTNRDKKRPILVEIARKTIDQI